MQTFDLKLWQTGEYDVVTAMRKKVKQLTYFNCFSEYPLAGVVETDLLHWSEEGLYDIMEDTEYDLRLIKKQTNDFEPGDIVFGDDGLEVIVTDDLPKLEDSFSGTVIKSTIYHSFGHHSRRWAISSFKKKP